VTRVLLFDVDGTLCLTGGAGVRAMQRAVAYVPGAAEAMVARPLDGGTDRAIVREVIEACGRACAPGEVDAVLEAYLGFLADELRDAPKYRLMPGVAELVPRLAVRDDVVVALGTGNLERGARLKLEHADLYRHFAFGGFGSDAEARAEILRVALQRAAAHLGRAVAPQECLVIGDTPRDVEAARAVGIPSLGVATGRHSVEALLAAGAGEAVQDLTRWRF
jgi:phosphoglycolate phosphatase-like HAD superfamily hydrolase